MAKKWPSRKKRIEILRGQFKPAITLTLKRWNRKSVNIISMQLASQYEAHIRDKPNLSANAKAFLKSKLAAAFVASASPVLKKLSNKGRYEAKIAESILAIENKNYEQYTKILEEISRGLGADKETANKWVSEAFIFFKTI